MFCPNCGKALEDESKFCNRCGEKIDNDKTTDENNKTNSKNAGVDLEKIEKNVKKSKNNNIKIIILSIIVLILVMITIPILMNALAQPEIVLPEGFVLESQQSGISTYWENESRVPLRIDIQQASVPLKNYPNMNYGVLKTNVNNTDYLIIIYGKDFSNSYLDYTGSNAQKALMKHKLEYMINEGHLHSSIDDVQYYGDFTKAPSEYKGY